MIKKYIGNPVLSAKDIPYESQLVFNSGCTKYNGKYVMVFRNDYDGDKAAFARFSSGQKFPEVKTCIGIAFSNDGINWEVSSKPCFELAEGDIKRAYDPRLTVIDGKVYMCFAADTGHGIRGGIAVTEDFDKFEILSLSVPDNLNMVLFPEKINGNFVRLERPFPVYGRPDMDEAFDIWLSESPDCKFWGNHRLLLGTEDVPFCSCKIGPAAPPVKTSKGWLTTFHAVQKVNREISAWHPKWNKVYYGGIMLLDLIQPWKIIGMSKEPLLSPEMPYEMHGFRGEVIFPGGMILEDSGEVKIYYGAADTHTCLATAHVDYLLELCLGKKPKTEGLKHLELCAFSA